MNTILAATGLVAGLAFASGASASFDDEKCGSTCGASQPRAALASNDAVKNIVETAVNNADFSTLVTLVGEAELVGTLAGNGPFTVFAPNNAAFQKLLSAKGNEKLLETLLDDKNRGLLQGILTYHVVPGKVMAKDVVKLANAGTANGQRVDIKFDKKAGTVSIDGAKVIATDIECSNGVIHVID
ncbi:MAG: fasciclin domain-containing protein, partial [Planctomycetota bacterium]|nr:fasciclin domain-containing protein [Planctomycetota bacterium]